MPSVKITKAVSNIGSVKNLPIGLLAIIASSQSYPKNTCGTFTRNADLVSQAGLGPGSEYAAVTLGTTGNAVLLVSPSTTTAPTIYGQGSSGPGSTKATFVPQSGTAVGTWSGTPLDEFHPMVQIVAGSANLATAWTYKYSLDGGQNWSGTYAGPSSGVIALLAFVTGGSTGVTLTLAAGSTVTGDTYYCYTTRPQMTNADLVSALEVLRITKLPWDNVLVDGDCSAQTVATIDAWITALEARGIFKFAWTNTRHKNRPVPTTESESAYATYLGTLLNTTSTINVDVGADGAEVSSPLTGIMQVRPTALFVAARAETFPVGTDPAEVDLGPLGGNPQITDTGGSPTWHDENLYPGLDAMRYSTLCSIDGENGTYIYNANILAPPGSDYVYDQHARTMNVACTVAFQYLTQQLSKGVGKQKPDAITGQIYIAEKDASRIETRATQLMSAALNGQVQGVALALARNDDLSSNQGATIHGDVQVESLAYIKNFAISAVFVETIAVAA